MSNYTDNLPSTDPDHVWNKIIRLIPEGAVVIDIGCSSGNLGKMLIDNKKCTVDGVEIDARDAKLARKKLREVYMLDVSKTTSLNTIKEKYDIIIFADVLEHLIDPVAVLRQVKILLKPSGRIIFSIPNMAHVSIRLALLQGDFDYTETGLIDRTHIHFYTEKEVKRIFHEAGLAIDVLDSSPYKYSDALITARLKKLGLEPSKKAIEMLQAPNAAAFQFVGAISQTSKKITTKAELPQTQAVHKDVQALTELLNENKKIIKLKENHINNLSHELDDIRSSKLYKVNQKLRTVGVKLNKTKK